MAVEVERLRGVRVAHLEHLELLAEPEPVLRVEVGNVGGEERRGDGPVQPVAVVGAVAMAARQPCSGARLPVGGRLAAVGQVTAVSPHVASGKRFSSAFYEL